MTTYNVYNISSDPKLVAHMMAETVCDIYDVELTDLLLDVYYDGIHIPTREVGRAAIAIVEHGSDIAFLLDAVS